jgi:hypothetical protein
MREVKRTSVEDARFGQSAKRVNQRQVHDAAVRMIDSSVVRVHQHGPSISGNNHIRVGCSPARSMGEDSAETKSQ